MGKSQRVKGASGERELCKLLSDALGETVTRQLGQARDGGGDIVLGRVLIEVKRRKRVSVYDWIAQAERAAGAAHVPVVAFRADGEAWHVIVPLDAFVRAFREDLSR